MMRVARSAWARRELYPRREVYEVKGSLPVKLILKQLKGGASPASMDWPIETWASYVDNIYEWDVDSGAATAPLESL